MSKELYNVNNRLQYDKNSVQYNKKKSLPNMSNAVLSMDVVSRYEIKFCIAYPAICVYSFNHTALIKKRKNVPT